MLRWPARTAERWVRDGGAQALEARTFPFLGGKTFSNSHRLGGPGIHGGETENFSADATGLHDIDAARSAASL